VEVATQAPVVDNIDTTTALTEQVKEAVEAGVEIKATTDKKKAVSKTAKGTKAGLNTYQDIVKKYGEDFVKYEMYNITDVDSYENYKTGAVSLTSAEADEIFKEDYEAFEEAYGAAAATFKPEYKKIIKEYNNQNTIVDDNTIDKCNSK
jgi:hypothetical protein